MLFILPLSAVPRVPAFLHPLTLRLPLFLPSSCVGSPNEQMSENTRKPYMTRPEIFIAMSAPYRLERYDSPVPHALLILPCHQPHSHIAVILTSFAFFFLFFAMAYLQRGNLNKHIRSIHRKERNFVCDRCPASFPFRNGLTEHQRMKHSDHRPFACTRCPASFKKKSHLQRHTTVVHKVAP